MNEKKNFFRASAEDFKKIPGSPIAYWVKNKMVKAFEGGGRFVGSLAMAEGKNVTTNNAKYIRHIWEVSAVKTGGVGRKWLLCAMGGGFRKWTGNIVNVIDWSDDARKFYKESPAGRIIREEFWNMSGVTWGKIGSDNPSFRVLLHEEMYQETAVLQHDIENTYFLLALLNACTSEAFLAVLSPTINFQQVDIASIPLPRDEEIKQMAVKISIPLVSISRSDWDQYETSWGFKVNPLVAEAFRSSDSFVSAAAGASNPVEESGQGAVSGGLKSKLLTAHFPLSTLFAQLRKEWAKRCEEMRRLEIENNRIFIEAYGLEDELTPDVPWNEISLTCNPWYRYGKTVPNGDSNEFPIDAELESRLKGDTVKELISYAVGCMMGRYSIDRPGLILADQGATLQDFLAKVPSPSYGVDEDGIIPILDNDWFADDIVTRFKEFVKVVFGEEHYFENMAWIEDALGKDIRSYFTKDFYKDHLQRYQNRPIYWLFQSPKGAFRALVYMHRYKPDMVGGVLGYLRSLQTKIDNQLDVAMQIGMDESKSASERVRANKDAVRFAKAKKELDEYERNVLYPLSTERIEIDLDDGVKVNYRKFGSALRKVAALEAKGE